MGLVMRRTPEGFGPAIVCDRCGKDVPASGLVVWRVDTEDDAADRALLVTCSYGCMDEIAEVEDPTGEWAATPVDAFLVSLSHELAIDPETVIAREMADWAVDHTRNEAPD